MKYSDEMLHYVVFLLCIRYGLYARGSNLSKWFTYNNIWWKGDAVCYPTNSLYYYFSFFILLEILRSWTFTLFFTILKGIYHVILCIIFNRSQYLCLNGLQQQNEHIYKETSTNNITTSWIHLKFRPFAY